MLRRTPLFALILVASIAGCRQEQAADIVMINGGVYTLAWSDPDGEGVPAADAPFQDGSWRPDGQALALRDGQIVYVGSDAGARAFVGPNTELIHLEGNIVIPGAVESHGHVHELGEHHEQLDLTTLESNAALADAVATRAAEVPAGEWIIGWGWDEGAWADNLPDWNLLNQRVPDNPVVLKGRRGFGALGNRLALEAAGFSHTSPNPDGGEVVRDASGERTGVVLNNALDHLYDSIPQLTEEQKQRILQFGLEEMSLSGFVATHHAGVRGDYMSAYQALSSSDRLQLRVHVMLAAVADNRQLLDEWVAKGPTTDLKALFQVRGVKAYYDGSLGSRGARLLDDYSDLTGHRGVSGDEYGFDEEVVSAMMAAGFQVGVHAIGDEGNREVLDFYERTFQDIPEARVLRHRVEHAQVIHRDDFSRFADLNLVASMEPGHAVEDSPWAEDRLGGDRIAGAYAWRTLRRQGVRLLLNSDYSGTDHSLFYGLYCAITRQNRMGEPAGGWYPEQRLSPEEALRGYTSWAAYASGIEDLTGTLEVGKWADLTVLSVDPLNITPENASALLSGEIRLTMVSGKVVYRNLPAGS